MGKTKSDADITSCKKQRNYAEILNQKVKCNYINNLDTNNGAEPFWKAFDTSIILIEKNWLILNYMKIVTIILHKSYPFNFFKMFTKYQKSS